METLVQNLPAWMAQTVLLASAGAVLPMVFRLRHPRTQLAYCHLVLAACLLLPWIEPWRSPGLLAPAAGSAEADVSRVESHSTASPLPAEVHPGRAMQPPLPASPVPGPRLSRWTEYTSRRFLPWVFAAGVLARLSWLLGGLWQIRRYRMAAMPLYPIPESVRAASAVTHADALFCISSHTPGPVMLGWLAPVVLLPESFLKLEDEGQCGIACHELLHARRGDWLLTVLEEAAGALLWFNPSAWLLLAQTRLAREQLVDAEAVRLTASREPYIEALLAIARGRPTSDLAPSPAFLQRRHLTHRMQSLLKEVSTSRSKLLTSYGFIAAMLVFTGWLACFSFPLTGTAQARATSPGPQRPQAGATALVPTPREATPAKPTAEPPREKSRQPVIVAFQAPQVRPRFAEQPVILRAVPIPPDAHEPVSGPVQIASAPADRAAALTLLERARENGLTHRAGTPPYQFEANFIAGGSAAYMGPGQATETWLSGHEWRWTANVGGYSATRSGGFGTATGEEHAGAIPMRVHMLRNAIFWAISMIPSSVQIRTAAVTWNGRPATCLLFSGVVSATEPGRLWDEEEYCVDNASALLQVHSIAPGTYSVYGYEKNFQFHGRSLPDRITIYVNGAMALEAQVTVRDAGAVDESQLRPTPQMLAGGPVATLALPVRFPMNIPSASVSGMAKAVTVHASVDGGGHVVEEELSSASDPALAQIALDTVKNATFEASGAQRQMYINVKFVPASQ